MQSHDNTKDASNVRSLVEWRRKASDHSQELTLLPAGSAFQIQILGDALTGQSIRHGDLIDCERVTTLEQGQLGLLKTPYGLMLRLYRSDGLMVRLEPANPEHAILCLPIHDVQIIARPVRLERWYVSFDEMDVAS